MLFSLQAASAGMAAPNPFMSDFSPAPGGQHVTSSSAGGGGMDLFEDQGVGNSSQINTNVSADLFGADFSSVGQAQGPSVGSQGTDLFGNVSGSDFTVLQPTETTGMSLGFEANSGEIQTDIGTEEAKPVDDVGSDLGKPQQPFSSFPSPVPPAPAPSPVVPTGASKVTSPPPPRPPPPTTGGTPRTMSPGPLSGSPSRLPASATSKSAFDDLNDSIRAALGGSPTRPPPPAGSTTQVPGQGVVPAPTFIGGAGVAGFGGFDIPLQGQPGGAVIPPQQQTMIPGGGGMVFGPPGGAPIGYGSPAKQGISMTGDDVRMLSLHYAPRCSG